MNTQSSRWLCLIACVGWLGCSNDSATPPNNPVSAAGSGGPTSPSGTAGAAARGGTGSPTGAAGSTTGVAGSVSSTAGRSGGGAGSLAAGSGAAGQSTQAGAGGAAPLAGAGGMSAGAGGAASGAGAAAGAGGGSGSATGNDLTGMLGALGPVQPVVNGWATTNGLETLIYLSTAPLTCAQMMTKGVRWLSTLPAKSQVIEIVVRGTAMVGTTQVGTLQGEINYAEGSKSSSTETVAKSGSITFTKAEAKKLFEGTLMATYANGSLMGKFHAEWCEGGSEY